MEIKLDKYHVFEEIVTHEEHTGIACLYVYILINYNPRYMDIRHLKEQGIQMIIKGELDPFAN